MTKFLLFVICLFSFCGSFSQTQFDTGFESGFKKGYCFDKPYGCLAPIPTLPPVTRLNENENSWQDGYDRGFVVGKELSTYQENYQSGGLPLTPNYVEPINPVPRVYSGGKYIQPLDLNLLEKVLTYKQQLFDTRGKWLQERIDNLALLNEFLLSVRNPKMYAFISADINLIINELNKGGDLTNNNYFLGWASKLRNDEDLIMAGYLYAKK